MKKEKYEIVGVNHEFFKEPQKEKGVVYLPKTPSRWLTETLELHKINKLTMSYGGGLGGSCETLYIKELPFAAFQPNTTVEVEIFGTGEKVLINTNFLVKVEKKKIGIGFYHSNNSNYKIGVWKVVCLLDYDTNKVITRNTYK